MYMRNLLVFAALLCGLVFSGVGFAETVEPFLGWDLLWSGSWGENDTLHNRGELKIDVLPFDLLLRCQLLDRRPVNIDFDDFHWDELFGAPEKRITHLTSGLYHPPTGSKLLFGVVDEWGLPARIRSPWIRSPPYPENHRAVNIDLKTAASSTKEDEVYLNISSPYLELFPNAKLKGFISGQTNINDFTPAVTTGLELFIDKNTRLMLETFYTERILPPAKINTWFVNWPSPPALPERKFRLYAAGLLYTNPDFSVSSDFALSETFAWGTDIYTNLGLSFSPSLSIGTRPRPLLISLAADGAGQRFVSRDGANIPEGFRTAARIDWRGRYNSLLRFSTVLRAPGLGEDFNRSSTNFFYRAPSSRPGDNILKLSRISIYADRNAVNPLKINDSFTGTFGLSINLHQYGIRSPINVNFSGSVKGITALESNPYPIPGLNELWLLENTSIGCDLFWSNKRYQLRAKVEYTYFVEKDEKWGISFSVSRRFNFGRLSFKIESPDFPEKWNWAASWRLETGGKL